MPKIDIESLVKNIANVKEEEWTAQDALFLLLQRYSPCYLASIAKKILSINERINFATQVEDFKTSAFYYGFELDVEELEQELDSHYLWFTRDHPFIKKILRFMRYALYLVGFLIINFIYEPTPTQIFIFSGFGLTLYVTIKIFNEIAKLRKQSERVIRCVNNDKIEEMTNRCESNLIELGWLKN